MRQIGNGTHGSQQAPHLLDPLVDDLDPVVQPDPVPSLQPLGELDRGARPLLRVLPGQCSPDLSGAVDSTPVKVPVGDPRAVELERAGREGRRQVFKILLGEQQSRRRTAVWLVKGPEMSEQRWRQLALHERRKGRFVPVSTDDI